MTKQSETRNSVSRRRLLGASAAGAVASTLPVFPFRPTQYAIAASTDGPLRQRALANLVIGTSPIAEIADANTRVRFFTATWDGGQTIVRVLEVADSGSWVAIAGHDAGHQFDEQWILFSGSATDSPYLTFERSAYYYSGYSTHWITFDQVTVESSTEVRLTSASMPEADFDCTWALVDGRLTVKHRVTAKTSGQFIVAYQAFDIHDASDITNVLCGTRQHSRYIDSAAAVPASELMAPASLLERSLTPTVTVTEGVFIPADNMEFEHLKASDPDNQPYGMSLRNESSDIQVAVFAPGYGERAQMTSGHSREFCFGIIAASATLPETFARLATEEYGLHGYRRNIHDVSLTRTLANIIDLIMVQPTPSSSGDFVPSPSGWWDRAKGFGDPENPGSVRQATAGVMTAAYFLTGDPQIYLNRGRALWEYQLSRTGISSSPIPGGKAPGNINPNGLCGTPADASTVAAIYLQSGQQNAGMRELALRALDSPLAMGVWRNALHNPIQEYALASDEERRSVLKAVAVDYAENEILNGYTDVLPSHQMQYHYFKGWLELSRANEIAGILDESVAQAAHEEARRLAMSFELSPVPEGNVTVPVNPRYVSVTGGSPVTWDYPRDAEPAESVPAWMVSTCGLGIEQLTTYRNEGFFMLPCYAPSLLRIAETEDDPLLKIVSDNLMVGRFTNYPGYKYWQHRIIQTKPDFPLQGPGNAAMMYYTHIAAMAGLVMDQLISEHVTRSGGQIHFPFLSEADYTYFTFRLYGHAPGTMCGDTDVWPCLPLDSVSIDNQQVNWLGGIGNGKLYISLTNATDTDQTAKLSIQESDVIGLPGGQVRSARSRHGNAPFKKTPVTDGSSVTVIVPASGIASVIFPGVADLNPLHHDRVPHDISDVSFDFSATPKGDVWGQIILRPDGHGYDAYVQVDTLEQATLQYSIDEGASWTSVPAPRTPNEWTIHVPDLSKGFAYDVVVSGVSTGQKSLRLSPGIIGAPVGAAVEAEVLCQTLITEGQMFPVSVKAYASQATPGATSSLILPTGWTATATSPSSIDVTAASPGHWTFDVAVPAQVTTDTETLAAEVTWPDGSATAREGRIRVRPALQLVSVRLSDAELGAGGASQITTCVVNGSRQTRSGTIILTSTGVPETVITDPSVDFTLAPYESTSVTTQVWLPSSAEQGSTVIVRANLAGSSLAAKLKVETIGIVTIDDLPPSFFFEGAWYRSGLSGYGGVASIYSPSSSTADLGAVAHFTPSIPETGSYRVAVWYPTNVETTTAAQFTVHAADGDHVVWVDQTVDARVWRELGEFDFTAGTSGSVSLTVTNQPYHRISAVQFLPA